MSSNEKINANDIRKGMVLYFNAKLWRVLGIMHTQPGKGGAYMQVEMKEVMEDTKLNQRFRSTETVDRALLFPRDFQFLYVSGDVVELMEQETYEQISVPKSMLGQQAQFLQEGMLLKVLYHGERPLLVEMPEKATCVVSECEPVVKGQTATSSYKPAVLDNGVRVMVPQFINTGDAVVVRIEDQEYIERAK